MLRRTVSASLLGLSARAALLRPQPVQGRLVPTTQRAFTNGARASAASGGGGGGGGGSGRASGAAIPPTPKRLPAEVLFGKVEGEERGEDAMDPPIRWTDDLFWLRDDERKSDGVLSHLKAENAYTDALTAHLADARTSLYAELKGHVKETDTSAPVPWGDYEYFTKTEEGKSYRIHCR